MHLKFSRVELAPGVDIETESRILDLQTLTWYGYANEIMADWAHQLMKLLTTPHDHMVPDSDDFAWAPF